MALAVHKATVQQVPQIAPLFNAYRMFYKQRSNLKGATSFLTQRLANNESVVFLAWIDGKAVGFTQLYPIFSSVGMQRTWLLNDLFVAETARKKGVATALLDAAKNHGLLTGSRWLMLQTATLNVAAQKLYERNGWKKDEDYYVYNFRLVE